MLSSSGWMSVLCGDGSNYPQTLTAEIFREYLLLMRADEIEVAAKKGQVQTKPDALNLDKDWFKFWEKLKNY